MFWPSGDGAKEPKKAPPGVRVHGREKTNWRKKGEYVGGEKLSDEKEEGRDGPIENLRGCNLEKRMWGKKRKLGKNRKRKRREQEGSLESSSWKLAERSNWMASTGLSGGRRTGVREGV